MAEASTRERVAAGLWRWLKTTGLERFEMWREGSGWVLRGTVLLLSGGAPFEVRYEVGCDSAWSTRSAAVDLLEAGGERSLRLVAENGRWYEDGREQESVRDCIDIDLGWSPSTNTVPIRRLRLGVGETAAVTAAWVRFPELTLQLLAQEYRRLADRRYRYASAGGAFVAEIEVDDHGLVVDYGDVWQRVREAR